uniref:Major facilitator superfamily domain-containing protein 5 n=1 Tax=Anthurium amnicola TaxID=1678845 RepID=A0A1D1XL37_9ARAE
MGVVIERVEWEPGSLVYFFLFCSCFSSVFLLPYFSKNSAVVATRASHSSLLDLGPSAPFLRFQRRFLLLYSLASVIGGLETVFGEDEYQRSGASRVQMVLYLCAGAAASVFIGSFLGVLSDIFGPRKTCIIYCILHLLVGILRSVTQHPNIWMTSVCLAVASFMFLFSFETWMVTEHEKQSHRQDLLTDTFWLMIFFESASLIGSQVLSNMLIRNFDKGFFFPSVPAALLALIGILYIRKEWNGSGHFLSFRDYWKSFSLNILSGKDHVAF